MPQRMAGGGLGDACPHARNLDGPLQSLITDMLAPGTATARTDGHAPEGKQVRPTRPAIGTGVLACRRVWQVDPAIAAGRILALQHQRPPALPQRRPRRDSGRGTHRSRPPLSLCPLISLPTKSTHLIRRRWRSSRHMPVRYRRRAINSRSRSGNACGSRATSSCDNTTGSRRSRLPRTTSPICGSSTPSTTR